MAAQPAFLFDSSARFLVTIKGVPMDAMAAVRSRGIHILGAPCCTIDDEEGLTTIVEVFSEEETLSDWFTEDLFSGADQWPAGVLLSYEEI